MKPLRLLVLLVSLPLLLGGCGVEKEAVPVKPNLKYEIKDGTVTITGCDKKASGALTIPATIEGKPVTSIGYQAFSNCKSLTSITIPDSMTSIGDEAFEICLDLTSITIGNGVTSIGEKAFYFCNSLTSITIPDGVTSIGEGAFQTCTNLSSITIPDGVTSIGRNAFWNCSSLKSITIPDSVTSIGQWTFAGCSSLTSVTIGAGVTSIARLTFEDCRRLTTVTFLGDAPRVPEFDLGTPDERILNAFHNANPTIYRKPEAKGWGDNFSGRPVKLISEKP